jgi:hypothetical protein
VRRTLTAAELIARDAPRQRQPGDANTINRFDELTQGVYSEVPLDVPSLIPPSSVDKDAISRGTQFTLPLAALVNRPYPVVSIPAEERETNWIVTAQTFMQAGGESNPYTYVVLAINYGQGGANFTRTISLLASQMPTKFLLTARYINISAYYAVGGGTTPAIVSCAAVPIPSGYVGADYYAWQMVSGAGNVSYYNLITGAGVVGQVHAILKAAAAPGAVPLYPLLFDIASGVPAGSPMNGGRLDACFNIGDGRSYGDEFSPGSLYFQNGLTIGLSTDAGVYTAPAAGNYLVVDAKVGQ